jgi:hypothetical protein
MFWMKRSKLYFKNSLISPALNYNPWWEDYLKTKYCEGTGKVVPGLN